MKLSPITYNFSPIHGHCGCYYMVPGSWNLPVSALTFVSLIPAHSQSQRNRFVHDTTLCDKVCQ